MLPSSFRRMALREINSRTPQSENRNTAITPQNVNTPSAFLTPSPDEQVITQRGRRKFTQTSLLQSWSGFAGLEDTPPKTPQTPTKSPKKSPAKNSTPVRTSPRKRLQLNSPSTSGTPSPSKGKKNLSFGVPAKRRRIAKNLTSSSVIKSLRTLSPNQLVDILQKVFADHPNLVEEVGEQLPQPDMKPIEEKLEKLRKNIYQAFPWTKFGSNRDAFCYRRVSTHLIVFKKEVIEQGKVFTSNEHWSTVVDYVELAWSFTRKLPDWDNSSHNKLKEQVFKQLSGFCLKALKQGGFESDEYAAIKDRLEELKKDSKDSKELEPCIKFANMKIVD